MEKIKNTDKLDIVKQILTNEEVDRADEFRFDKNGITVILPINQGIGGHVNTLFISYKRIELFEKYGFDVEKYLIIREKMETLNKEMNKLTKEQKQKLKDF